MVLCGEMGVLGGEEGVGPSGRLVVTSLLSSVEVERAQGHGNTC